MNILIVDDIPANRRLLHAVLEAENHTILEAADGMEALAALGLEKVDAIISDILMPRMDGYRFCYEVRASERFRHLPFIFYTSTYTSSSDEKLALEIGADKFLTKPAPASEIVQALHEAATVQRGPFTPVEPSRELNLMKEYNQQLVAKLEQKNAVLKARNEELLRSEQKLLLQGTALETAANAVVITDTGGIILWVNPAFVALTGYTTEEALGQTPRLLKSGKHDRMFYQKLWETILAGRTWRGTFTNRRKDGSLYHDEHTITPVRSQDGAITHFIAIMNDVTARKRAEEESRTMHAQLQHLLEHSPAVLYQLRIEGERVVPVVVSDNIRRLLGVTIAECSSYEWWLESLHPEDKDRAVATLAKGLKEGGYSTEYRIRHKDGTYRWVEDNNRVVMSASSAATEMIGVWTDITERKRAEEVVRGVSSKEAVRRKRRSLMEMGLIIILSTLVFIIGHVFDVFDPVFTYLTTVNGKINSDLDEVMATLVFFFLALLVFSYRRRRESRREVGSQTQIAEALRLLHGEMEKKVQERTAELVQANETLHTEIIERKRAEETIKQFPAIVESTDDAIISTSLDGTITTWNPAAERMFGYSTSEILGRSAQALVPSDRSDETLNILAHIERGQSVRHFETVRVRKDGRPLDVSITISPIKDAGGENNGISNIIRDITENKRTEESLKLFRALMDQSNDAVEVIDPETGRFLDVNERAWKRLGYSREEMLSMGITDVEASAVTRASLAEHLEEIRKVGFKIIEGRHRRKDGSTFPIEVNVQYIHLNRGYLVAVVRDITERKRAEEQIAEQAAFLDKARDAIVVRDLEGKILFWNQGAERMYGWTREETLGRKIGELLYANQKKFEEINELTIRQGECSGELVQITKDRREITIEGRWTLIRDQAGNPKSVLVINTDITEKKKIEAQFMRAQRMESIGTLAGGIAHDLNNILAPIMLSIDVLKSKSTHPQAKSILETIEVSAKRGADIVRQVLSFARGLEGERIEIQPKHLLKDLEHIIKDTFPKDIHLRFSVPNDTWTILGDPTQVHQILLNLCVNARDAMPNGGNLTIGVENCVLDEQYAAMNLQAKAGHYVKIKVTDSGTGIPPAILEKIFDPFFTTKDLSKGTGLGLSTVMAIVKSHDGVINVYSEQGKGTTFNVYLPAMETSSETTEDLSEEARLPRGNGETVLVVDDEASILTITSQTLQAFGYKVLTATDGADAVAIYLQHRDETAVVLTDMMMPVMDGPATIHALMRINPAIKIIAASGLNANGGVAKVAEAGVRHFLTKPYTAGTLLKTMRAILDETSPPVA